MILTGETEVLGEKHYTAWVVDGWMSMEQWWNDTDSGKPRYWERNLSRCFFVYHKSPTERPGFEFYLRYKRPSTNPLSHGTAQRNVSEGAKLHGAVSFFRS